MNFGKIKGANVALGAPKEWDPEKDGECGVLHVLREKHSPGVERMLSAWYPTPEEITRLALGAPLVLTVIGSFHPPVSIDVASVPSPPIILDRRIMPHPGPEHCRNRLRSEGKPHPKSGCQACQGWLRNGCPHEKQDGQPAQ